MRSNRLAICQREGSVEGGGEVGTDIGNLENQRYKPSAFANFKDDAIELVPLMYQAGYLTIDEYEPILGTYKLKYPNADVCSSFEDLKRR